jgi:hypothetical protein
LFWPVPKPKEFREVAQGLREHDPRFEFRQNRGKGTEIYPGVLRSIIRRFNLPAGIFD